MIHYKSATRVASILPYLAAYPTPVAVKFRYRYYPNGEMVAVLTRSGNPNKGAVNAVIYDGETSFWIASSRFKKVGAARSYCDFEAVSTGYDDQLRCWSDDGFDRTWSLETFGQHTVEVMHNKNGIRLVN